MTRREERPQGPAERTHGLGERYEGAWLAALSLDLTLVRRRKN